MNKIYKTSAAALFLAVASTGMASACSSDFTARNVGPDSLVSVMSFGCGNQGSFDAQGIGNRTFATLEYGADIVTATYGHRNHEEFHSTTGGAIVSRNEASDTFMRGEAHRGGTIELHNQVNGAKVSARADHGASVRMALYR